MTDKIRLHTLLGDYTGTRALKAGQIPSDLVEFDFADVKVANTAFKPLVREAKFDCRRARHHDLPAGQGVRQALRAAAGRRCRTRPAPHHRL